MKRYRIAVLGNGPVGILAALHAARQGHGPVLLLAADPPASIDAEGGGYRIEAVPVSMLALLLEYGIHPHLIGAGQTHAVRQIQWDSQSCMSVPTPRTVHIHRPALEQALWQKLLQEPRIHLHLGEQSLQLHDVGVDSINGDNPNNWHADLLIDASGRAARTASSIDKSQQPWVARLYTLANNTRHPNPVRSHFQPHFKLAALPEGYVYSLATPEVQNVVFVGRGKAVKGSAKELQKLLQDTQAEWVLQGLPQLTEFHSGMARPVSLQWAASARSVLIGDAALARDILSSQGLSCGLSEALCVADLGTPQARANFQQRQKQQRQLHATALLIQIRSCLYGMEAAWQDYAQFIMRART
ncbi:NAD(P)/FAD-dependent oxidoreductase [Undibacterium sp. Ji42W]|uniref:NAD(P)/FAD-dependent oxidoreductase n=1 Tax=Undibacterium sp. Ji42W TaxID=3413039 RepID=UPI003BF1E163